MQWDRGTHGSHRTHHIKQGPDNAVAHVSGMQNSARPRLQTQLCHVLSEGPEACEVTPWSPSCPDLRSRDLISKKTCQARKATEWDSPGHLEMKTVPEFGPGSAFDNCSLNK